MPAQPAYTMYIMVATLGGDAHAIQAEHLQGGCVRQWALEGVKEVLLWITAALPTAQRNCQVSMIRAYKHHAAQQQCCTRKKDIAAHAEHRDAHSDDDASKHPQTQ